MARPRGAAAPPGDRRRDLGPRGLVGRDALARRVGAPRPPALHVARPRARRQRRRGGRTSPAALPLEDVPLVRLPGGTELRAAERRPGLARAGDRPRARGARGGRPGDRRRGPAGLGAAVYGASEGLDTLIIESTVLAARPASAPDRHYLGFPAGITCGELTARAVTQAREFGRGWRRRSALASSRAASATSSGSTAGRRSPRARSSSPPARSTAGCRSTTSRTTRASASSTPRARPRPSAAARPESRRRRRQLRCASGDLALPRRRARDAAAPPRRPARDDVRLPIGDLERNGVAVRDRSEIAELHGTDGQLQAVTLRNGEQSPLLPVPVPRRVSLHRLARHRRCPRRQRLRPHRAEAGAGEAIETSVPGVYAAGDARSAR